MSGKEHGILDVEAMVNSKSQVMRVRKWENLDYKYHINLVSPSGKFMVFSKNSEITENLDSKYKVSHCFKMAGNHFDFSFQSKVKLLRFLDDRVLIGETEDGVKGLMSADNGRWVVAPIYNDFFLNKDGKIIGICGDLNRVEFDENFKHNHIDKDEIGYEKYLKSIDVEDEKHFLVTKLNSGVVETYVTTGPIDTNVGIKLDFTNMPDDVLKAATTVNSRLNFLGKINGFFIIGFSVLSLAILEDLHLFKICIFDSNGTFVNLPETLNTLYSKCYVVDGHVISKVYEPSDYSHKINYFNGANFLKKLDSLDGNVVKLDGVGYLFGSLDDKNGFLKRKGLLTVDDFKNKVDEITEFDDKTFEIGGKKFKKSLVKLK